MTYKFLNVADTNLISGSSELIRQEFRGYYVSSENSIVEDGAVGSRPTAGTQEFDSNYAETSAPVDPTSLIKSLKFANRVYGTTDSTSIRSDQEWKAYVIGGTFGSRDYSGFYNEEVYFDHQTRVRVPLYQNELTSPSQNISGYSIAQFCRRYGRYQDNLQNIESEHLIPNYYFLKSPDSNGLGITKFVELEGSVDAGQISNLFGYTETAADSPRYKYENVQAYLDVDYTNHQFSEELKQELQNKLQNIIFLDPQVLSEANEELLETDLETMNNRRKENLFSLMPLSNDIYLETTSGDAFAPIKRIISTNDYSPRFMKTLKEVFEDEIELKAATVDFQIFDNNSREVSTRGLKVVDLPEMLLYDYENLSSRTDNCMFYNNDSEEVKATFDETGASRFVNSEIAINTLNDLVGEINTRFTNVPNSLEEFLNNFSEIKRNETLAYRIQKIGGPPTGDSRTENTLQNFWFFNTTSVINYIDTQVKYGQDYTYKIYAYVAIQGYKYKLSDLAITRQIAKEGELYCLEFYDPATGQVKESLFDLTSLLSEDNQFATNAQTKGLIPYLADFNINIEPSLKIVEVPIQEKTFKILDNPPNDIITTPHHIMDQSNRLAFFLSYDTFSPDSVIYPTALTTQDDDNKADYLAANDFDEDDFIQHESVSMAETFEVYRLSRKPTSYQDFENNLRKSINLRILKQGRIKLDAMFMEKVRPNQKYYYTFRAINENGIAGEFTPIFEAELINDGGYVYANFNQLSAEDLVVDNISEPLMSFKKLFNVVPNIQHLILDSTEVDFSKSAFEEVGNFKLGTAEEPLFSSDAVKGKTFKLRLTSKKTGKKIDLNITFNKTNG